MNRYLTLCLVTAATVSTTPNTIVASRAFARSNAIGAIDLLTR